MLKTLAVSNFALIEQASVDFAEGLNVLTGETGAGKSILVDALCILLGSRASVDFIRSGCDSFRVEAVFEIAGNKKLSELLADQGIDTDEGILIISRLLSRQGKTTALANGCHVTVSILKQIGDLLIDMHGQHDNQALLKTESYLPMLDSFLPEVKDKVSSYYQIFKDWVAVNDEIAKLKSDSRQRAQRLDMLEWQTAEIGAASLNVDEEEKLEKDISVLANAEKIVKGLSRSYSLLNDEVKGALPVLSALAEIKKELEFVSRYDDNVVTQLTIVTDALYQLEDVASELRDYCEKQDFSQEKLGDLQERLNIIHNLKKKYGATVAEVIDYYNKALLELSEISNYEERLTKLDNQKIELDKLLEKAADDLTTSRRNAAGKMSVQICSQLMQLGMPKAKLDIDVKIADRYMPTGNNEVFILFSANPGEELKPLQKIASGGELSRVALAIKTVDAGRDGVSTMIFDEIDTGIGGQIGQMVAEKIAMVSRKKQVLCVTHLPQIAAMADYHIYVAKDTDGERTRTVINVLADEARCLEVARMIFGDNVTVAAIDNSTAMIAAANDKKRKMEI